MQQDTKQHGFNLTENTFQANFSENSYYEILSTK